MKTLMVVAMMAALLTACDSYSECDRPEVVCDDHGSVLVYAPYIYPAYGIYGQPGYIAPRTVYPGAPGYRETFVGKPPTYTPPKPVARPPTNPGNTKPVTPPKPAVQPGYKPPSAPKVDAPKVNAPKPAAPAPKPAPPPARSK